MRYDSKKQLITEFKKLLLDKQTSQREAAKKLNITPQALTKIMNKQNFSFDDMQKLLSVVNYDMIVEFVPAAIHSSQHYETGQQTVTASKTKHEKHYKTFTDEEEKQIDLQKLSTNVHYQLETALKFGENVLADLMEKARQQEPFVQKQHS